MKSIIVDGVEYIPKDSAINLSNFCIIRCRNAGVHFGEVTERGNGIVKIKNSRRLWRWWSKATLSELAMEGPRIDKISEQRYGCVLPELELTEMDVCEIIACSELAAKAIMGVDVWTAK
jgi:hypothetical protein